MAARLNIPIVPDQEDTLSLGGTIFKIHFTYNERDNAGVGRWRIDIQDEFGNEIISGVKLIEPQSLLLRYKLDNFAGDLEVVRTKDTEESVNFDNIGIGKEYELLFLSEEEIAEEAS